MAACQVGIREYPSVLFSNLLYFYLTLYLVNLLAMEDITDITVEACCDSKFVQPFRVKYRQVGSSLAIRSTSYSWVEN